MEELTPEQNYRFTIIEAINSLTKVKQELFEKLTNVAMAGEFNDADRVFEEGESINFDANMFKNCEDKNVQLLLVVMKAAEDVKSHMVKAYNISDDELNITVTTGE